MKVKKGFNLREVCGEHIIVAEGDENIDFSNIISMNESSAYLWEEVQNRESFTVDSLVELLCNQYEIDENTARKDATTLASQWAAAHRGRRHPGRRSREARCQRRNKTGGQSTRTGEGAGTTPAKGFLQTYFRLKAYA